MHNMIDNVGQLYAKYGNRITTDKQLLLTYWKVFDNVRMDKSNMSVEDFIENATSPKAILSAKMAWQILKKED